MWATEASAQRKQLRDPARTSRGVVAPRAGGPAEACRLPKGVIRYKSADEGRFPSTGQF